MRDRRLTTSMLVALVSMDVGFIPAIPAIMANVGGLRLWPALLFYVAGTAVKYAVWWRYVHHHLGPTEALRRRADRGYKITEVELRTADQRIQAAPIALATVASVGTSLSIGATFLLHHLLVGPSELRTLSIPVFTLIALTTAVGAFPMFVPRVLWSTSDAAGRNSILAAELGVDLERPQRSIAGRLMASGFALTLTPFLVLAAALFAMSSRSSYDSAQLEALAWTGRLTQEAVGGAPDLVARLEPEIDPRRVTLVVVDRSASIRSAGAALPGWASSDTLVTTATRETTVPDRSVALNAFRLPDGRVVASIVAMRQLGSGLLSLLAAIAAAVAIFGPVASWMLSRSLSVPLAGTAELVRRAAQEGDLSAMGNLPVPQLDEVGMVSQNLNELLDDMREIARAAGKVADGSLSVDLEGDGELPTAFRLMVEQLRSVVEEMNSTSAELASAATEIFAASQEQAAATASHSTGMTEVSQTMDSLSGSAAHVAHAVQGVLDNAERTLTNTDQMVSRIDDLTGHANRIADILDVIREIADRTDLLALNGSLEASRAGEAGVGFSLVASEMRRLAERVTGSVGDIKTLVSDIRESGASTVVATEESKKLAESTTQAARSITLVTQQQQSSTEQVSQNVRTMADVVQQSAGAAAQARISAEGLKEQADRLAALVRRFELSR